MTDSINLLINDKGVCRTAPATPGLLNIIFESKLYKIAIIFCVAIFPVKPYSGQQYLFHF